MTKSPQTTSTFMRFKQTYAPLYRTLLVLSSLAALASLYNFTALPWALAQLGTESLSASISIIQLLVVTPIMIVSILLLWNRDRTGLTLRIGGYLGSIILALLSIAFPAPIPEAAITEIQSVYATQLQTTISSEDAETLLSTSAQLGLWLTVLFSGLFLWLWYTAWKKQRIYEERHAVKHASKKTS